MALSHISPVAPDVGLGHHTLFGADGQTMMHPAMMLAISAAVVLMFALRRKYVVIPLLMVAMTAPMGQMLMVGPFHFQVFRILIVFAWIRIVWEKITAKSVPSWKLNALDKVVLGYALANIVCYTILWQESAAFFDEVGKAFGSLGYYFAFRFFVRDENDVKLVIKTFAFVAMIIGAVMLNEQMTGKNALFLFGAPQFSAMRAGYIRAQGPFSVYLTAGAFGATLIPLFLSLWQKQGSKTLSLLGMAAAITITLTSNTSTAISACLAVAIAIAAWGLRAKMRWVRWGVISLLASLHLAMKAPVWALLARVDLVGGSTGWHRFKIVDNFIHHFWDWWLFGSNNYWNWEGGDDMWDTANHYVATGENAGLLPLILLIAMIVYCFKYLGGARRAAGQDQKRAWFIWLLGVSLLANLVAFLGITYFDQTEIYWYALLAMIVAATACSQQRVITGCAVPATSSDVRSLEPDLVYSNADSNGPGAVAFIGKY